MKCQGKGSDAFQHNPVTNTTSIAIHIGFDQGQITMLSTI